MFSETTEIISFLQNNCRREHLTLVSGVTYTYIHHILSFNSAVIRHLTNPYVWNLGSSPTSNCVFLTNMFTMFLFWVTIYYSQNDLHDQERKSSDHKTQPWEHPVVQALKIIKLATQEDAVGLCRNPVMPRFWPCFCYLHCNSCV